MAKLSVMAKESTDKTPATLGDVLYANSNPPVPEQEWATLVQSIAAGDQLALHALYERAHRVVFTLIMRITANREIAEELTIDVFHDVWRRAARYDPANGTVLDIQLGSGSEPGTYQATVPPFDQPPVDLRIRVVTSDRRLEIPLTP